MILGRGDIAKAIKDREGFTFYCNGVSNRTPFNEHQRLKESNELWRIFNVGFNGMFVYISSLSIYYSDSEYTMHKIFMESFVKSNFNNYCILRIGNITWGDNPNTLINHLKKDTSRIEDTFRYLIFKEEFNHWVGLIPKMGKHEMNVTGEMISIKEIVHKYIS